jgi:sphingolipid 4-desaturase/C4-monooxygenase
MDFFRIDGRDPHRDRARAVLAAHPEARPLIGRNPWTAVIALGVVLLQTIVALIVGWSAVGLWLVPVLAAACLGAFANHALYVVIHEATHSLIFRRQVLNRLVLLLADLPNVLPGAMAFRAYHLMHHAHRSQYNGDPDIPNDWEARLVRNIWWRKALWLALFPLLQLTRIPRVPRTRLFDGWALANYAACGVYTLAIWQLAGAGGVVYLIASFLFATGLHPLGARWVSEHYVLEPRHDTNSYYGPINVIALNIGYHNEHHDLPHVPWNRLPRLKALAPEFYDPLPAHRSWLRLFVDFIFDQRYWLYSRLIRPPVVGGGTSRLPAAEQNHEANRSSAETSKSSPLA